LGADKVRAKYIAYQGLVCACIIMNTCNEYGNEVLHE